MNHGYIYCFSNPSMVGILKIGMTQRKPYIRLCEANSSDTWRPPTPYVLEFAKYVLHPREKELALHNLLARYTERIHQRREFFRVTPSEVLAFFDLIDGKMWRENESNENETEYDNDDEDETVLSVGDTQTIDDPHENEEYIVEEILDHRFEDKRRAKTILYLHVKWLGYVATSWEPYQNLQDVEKVHIYLLAHKMNEFIPERFRDVYITNQTSRKSPRLRKNDSPKEEEGEVEMEFDF